jgi:hypothetical protein
MVLQSFAVACHVVVSICCAEGDGATRLHGDGLGFREGERRGGHMGGEGRGEVRRKSGWKSEWQEEGVAGRGSGKKRE